MARDTSRDGLVNRLRYYVLTHFRPIWNLINRIDWLSRVVNRWLINNAVGLTPGRPDPFSTLAPYTTWDSLTDRTWFGRHLPPTKQERLPDPAAVAELFRRPSAGARLSDKSTVLFPAFAQWFTDGFLLTNDADRRRTHSNHQLDFAPLYGLKKDITDCLRLKSERPGQKGRLKSRELSTGEYPLPLFDEDGITVRQEFQSLPMPLRLPWDWPAAKRKTLFAVGGERTNTTPQTAMLNTLFLREHNRVCNVLERSHPAWDDERIFQTARNVVIALLIKVVVEEYINHISPYYMHFRADPSAAWSARWNRPNWFTVEFNLLYRWHSLVPDRVEWADQTYAPTEWLFNNEPLTRVGLGPGFDATSRQKAGEIGLFNTPEFLLPTETASIAQGRLNALATYNDYRAVMDYPRVTSFRQISGDDRVVEGLKSLYGTADRVEFYVGLFAEDPRPNAAVPSLIGRMVAVDAFSQALTNPLLSEHLFNANTFSTDGMEILESTHTLRDVVGRNVQGGVGKYFVSMTQEKLRP
jgi:prostaglandin-endoperoxide synthase 2